MQWIVRDAQYKAILEFLSEEGVCLYIIKHIETFLSGCEALFKQLL